MRAMRSAWASTSARSRFTASTAFQNPVGASGEPVDTAFSAASRIASTRAPSMSHI